MPRSRLALCVAAIGLVLAGCAAAPPPRPTGEQPPNIVFVLVDDMDQGLLQHMPQVRRMQRDGVTFSNFTVTDSLCCPSRASLLAGKYPHNTGVFTNEPPDGGFEVFHRRDESDTIGTQLQQAGYRTGFLGKYLNGYQPGKELGGERPFVPPGWNEWAVAGNGYPEYDYKLNVNGHLEPHGHRPGDYLTDVLAERGNDFIRTNAAQGKPFFLEVAPFVPHGPSTPAPRHADTFPGLTAPRAPSFDEPDRSDKPQWLRALPPLPAEKVAAADAKFRKRAQSLQAVDEMLAGFQRTLEETGQAQRTHVIFTSDNGFHLGEHALPEGKQTAFDHDVRVPLVATGPGVPAGRTVPDSVQNIDFRPTFAEIAGAPPRPDLDGVSFAGLLRGESGSGRDVALVEHHEPRVSREDPDHQERPDGVPPTYTAIRTPEGTYVEYLNGEREYYDDRTDPHQLNNSYQRLPADERERLHRTLTALAGCRGADACTAAASSR
ncbi:sulfatase family protein [Saccharopolyspora mangrovi]|uniref:Sulfatase n=1 Tax=Saccharopolyspora mangrovi TaxID=3082379 RepID=A0ABU6AAM0_9PSEU|nr:sulfatase [Saccharopolyspora sp. S2-29]MEB3368622.1 sulfatase [Saccharopolyspora sp. S2-29]